MIPNATKLHPCLARIEANSKFDNLFGPPQKMGLSFSITPIRLLSDIPLYMGTMFFNEVSQII